MKKYTIVRKTGTFKFQEVQDEVNELIKLGWKPIGGICVDDNWAVQAMIRE